MSLKKVSKEQPDQFKFSDENLNLAKKIILNYPSGKKKKCSYGAALFSAKTKQ